MTQDGRFEWITVRSRTVLFHDSGGPCHRQSQLEATTCGLWSLIWNEGNKYLVGSYDGIPVLANRQERRIKDPSPAPRLGGGTTATTVGPWDGIMEIRVPVISADLLAEAKALVGKVVGLKLDARTVGCVRGDDTPAGPAFVGYEAKVSAT